MKIAIWIVSILFVGAVVLNVVLFKKINALTPAAPKLLADGTACTMPDGSAGTYKGGVCVKTVATEQTQKTASLISLDDLIKSLQKLQPDSKLALDFKIS